MRDKTTKMTMATDGFRSVLACSEKYYDLLAHLKSGDLP